MAAAECDEASCANIIQHLPRDLQAGALALICDFQDTGRRALALARIAAQVPEAERSGVVESALTAARATADDWIRSDTLAYLAPALPDSFKQPAYAFALTLADPWARADGLGELAEVLPEPLRSDALREALAAARRAPSAWQEARALTGVAGHLPE
jgi:hypothetical protein